MTYMMLVPQNKKRKRDGLITILKRFILLLIIILITLTWQMCSVFNEKTVQYNKYDPQLKKYVKYTGSDALEKLLQRPTQPPSEVNNAINEANVNTEVENSIHPPSNTEQSLLAKILSFNKGTEEPPVRPPWPPLEDNLTMPTNQSPESGGIDVSPLMKPKKPIKNAALNINEDQFVRKKSLTEINLTNTDMNAKSESNESSNANGEPLEIVLLPNTDGAQSILEGNGPQMNQSSEETPQETAAFKALNNKQSRGLAKKLNQPIGIEVNKDKAEINLGDALQPHNQSQFIGNKRIPKKNVIENDFENVFENLNSPAGRKYKKSNTKKTFDEPSETAVKKVQDGNIRQSTNQYGDTAVLVKDKKTFDKHNQTTLKQAQDGYMQQSNNQYGDTAGPAKGGAPLKKLKNKNKVVEKNIKKPKKVVRNLSVDEIAEIITENNVQPIVFNEDLFPNPINPDTLIIAVQVESRTDYLEYLIKSFEDVKGIADVLLIFSHAVYDANVNELVQSIRYCRVMQIFYPHSIQTHPRAFPGNDGHDCPSTNITQKEAAERQCSLRNAERTQNKNHFWWHSYYVFNQLEIAKDQNGYVLFLEEGDYLANDALHMLKLMQKQAAVACPKCNVFSLGHPKDKTVDDYRTFQNNYANISPFFNRGFAFNRTTWNNIVHCSTTFCSSGDDAYDNTLEAVSEQCLSKNNSQLMQMYLERTRLFHLGNCNNSTNCNPSEFIAKIDTELKVANIRQEMYPEKLQVLPNEILGRTVPNHGGWFDKRDHQLCLNISASATLLNNVFNIPKIV